MEFKISIIDASPEELAQVFANIQAIQSGSTIAVETKTKNVSLHGRGPVKEAESADGSEEDLPLTDELRETFVAKKEEAEPAKTRTRRSKAQIEADEAAARAAKKEPVSERRAARDEEEEPVKKRTENPTPNLVEKMIEWADRLEEVYTRENAEKVLNKILATFGVDVLSDVAPADRTAVIECIRRKIED